MYICVICKEVIYEDERLCESCDLFNHDYQEYRKRQKELYLSPNERQYIVGGDITE